MLISELEEALKESRFTYVDVSQNKTAPALVTDFNESHLNNILEAALAANLTSEDKG